MLNLGAATSPAAAARKKLQLRVVNMLKKWLDVSFLDFNDELIGQVFEFVDMLKKDGNTTLASMIDNILLTKLVGIRKKKEHTYDSPPPPPIVRKQKNSKTAKKKKKNKQKIKQKKPQEKKQKNNTQQQQTKFNLF